uniref:Polymerase nucleotidyl transferase domain-containing protein n=1 Tax=candidate division WWE3 bacterium TaxID=2053526 RepID=A0A7C4TIM0_UNCKA
MPTNKKFYFSKKSPVQAEENLSANKLRRVQRAILETLSYRAAFDYPLSFYQLANFLLTRKRVDFISFAKAVESLIKLHKISVKDGKYYLYKAKTVDWDRRKSISLKFVEKAKKVTEMLAKIPWIQFVGLTGSIAALNADNDSDIDMIIITKRDRVWLTRGFLFLILKIMGELRTEESSKQKICPNIFIDESNLAWPKNKRNVYTAHEVLMVRPLFDRDNTYLKFLKANIWIKGYFGNLECDLEHTRTSGLERNVLFNLVEKIAMFLQKKYMGGKITNEITKPNFIHFNKTDSSTKILAKFNESKGKL